MSSAILPRRFCNVLVLFAALFFFTASAWATIVWELNPQPRQNAPVGSTSRVYTSQGYSITAYGFDNNGGVGTPSQLYYKNVSTIGGAVEFGLGLVNTDDHELKVSANGPLDFIQFDFTAALAAGLLNGKISVGSIQAGEAFSIYGSNTLGLLGTKLDPGAPYGSTFDNQFVALPNFGQFDFYSIVAASGDILPIALSAEPPPAVPEVSALLPIIALVLALLGTQALRRRRASAS